MVNGSPINFKLFIVKLNILIGGRASEWDGKPLSDEDLERETKLGCKWWIEKYTAGGGFPFPSDSDVVTGGSESNKVGNRTTKASASATPNIV